MFGYVMARMEEISPEERSRYQAFYCGVCRALGERFGQRCRLGLTYDMTFLAMLLSSLYEPEEKQSAKRCVPHPTKPHPYISSECIDYAADMTVALVYHKCLDDWNDDRSRWGRTYAKMIERSYNKVCAQYPRTCSAIEEGLTAIGRLERAALDVDTSQTSSPDEAANYFGALLGEVFVYREDFWAEPLRAFGAKLGKLVYVMDAAIDREDDRVSGSYNPLVALEMTREDILEDLQFLAADAAAAFEKLPLVGDVHILRSVLYAGLWQQYYAKEAKRDKEARRG